MFSSLGPNADCSKKPTPAQATCGYDGLPAVSFKGGSGQPVAPHFIPPWCATSHKPCAICFMTECYEYRRSERVCASLCRSLRVDVGPGRYNYAPTFSKDGSAGPDGGTLPLSSQCDWAFHSNREGGNDQAASWSVVPYPGSQPYSMCAIPPPPP